MKRFTFIVCFSLLLILLIMAVPVTASTSTTISSDKITAVSPSGGPTGKTVSVTISGNNFTADYGTVRLEMSGEDDIDGTLSSWTVNSIECTFKLSTSRATGNWDLVVIKGLDQTIIAKTDAFTITDKISLTSIDPKTGQMGNDVDFTLKGKNFDEDLIEQVYLYKKGNRNITDDNVDVKSSTELKGTFDLDDAEEDTYDVCIEDKSGVVVCDLSFEVTTNEVGSIDFASNPSGATIYINNIANGTTPTTVDDLIAGSYKIVLKKSGYEDWGKIVTVEADETAEVDAKLYAATTATSTTVPTTAQQATARPTTARTTAKSTIKVPTSWANTPTTTAASPVDPVIIIGTIGLAFLALRKP